jgi:hypothetical protein
MIFTANRGPDELLAMFADPMCALRAPSIDSPTTPMTYSSKGNRNRQRLKPRVLQQSTRSRSAAAARVEA